MGGFKSGRRRWLSGPSEAQCLGLSVFALKRTKALDLEPEEVCRRTSVWESAGQSFGSVGLTVEADPQGRPALVWLSYEYRGTPVRYAIQFTSTRCNYGGVRWWFICPVVGCGRRVAKLYLPPVGNHFICRHCARLVYAVTRMRLSQRLLRRVEKIQNRLGWSNPLGGERPKRMHTPTFAKLVDLYNRYFRLAVQKFYEQWGIKTGEP